MATPHIRDLDLPNWHEVPEGAVIPTGTRYLVVFPDGSVVVNGAMYDYPAADRKPCNRYFTAAPIPDPREAEIEAEAERLWLVAYPDGKWPGGNWSDRVAFRRLAADSLDRQASSCAGCGTPASS